MARILVQTDEGQTVQTIEFPMEVMYATYLIPSCPTNVAVNRLLNQLRRALDDTEAVQNDVDPRRLSERVMDSLAERE